MATKVKNELKGGYPRKKVNGELTTSTRGRKSKKDPEVIAKLLSAFGNGFTETEACYYAEIDPVTLWRWKKGDEHFSNQVLMAQAQPSMFARQTMVTAIKGGKWMAAAWWLERKHKDEFALRTEIDGKMAVATIEITQDQYQRINDGDAAAANRLTSTNSAGSAGEDRAS